MVYKEKAADTPIMDINLLKFKNECFCKPRNMSDEANILCTILCHESPSLSVEGKCYCDSYDECSMIFPLRAKKCVNDIDTSLPLQISENKKDRNGFDKFDICGLLRATGMSFGTPHNLNLSYNPASSRVEFLYKHPEYAWEVGFTFPIQANVTNAFGFEVAKRPLMHHTQDTIRMYSGGNGDMDISGNVPGMRRIRVIEMDKGCLCAPRELVGDLAVDCDICCKESQYCTSMCVCHEFEKEYCGIFSGTHYCTKKNLKLSSAYNGGRGHENITDTILNSGICKNKHEHPVESVWCQFRYNNIENRMSGVCDDGDDEIKLDDFILESNSTGNFGFSTREVTVRGDNFDSKSREFESWLSTLGKSGPEDSSSLISSSDHGTHKSAVKNRRKRSSTLNKNLNPSYHDFVKHKKPEQLNDKAYNSQFDANKPTKHALANQSLLGETTTSDINLNQALSNGSVYKTQKGGLTPYTSMNSGMALMLIGICFLFIIVLLSVVLKNKMLKRHRSRKKGMVLSKKLSL